MEYVDLGPNEYHVLHPRPAYLIVTLNEDGKPNVMAASWVSPVNDEPLIVALALGKESKTFENITRRGELTINIMGEEHIDLVYKAGSVSGREVNKWEYLGLKPVKPSKIGVPGIEGSYGFVECVVEKVIDLEGVGLVLCRSVAIHVRKELMYRRYWDLSKARILLHNIGRSFSVPGLPKYAKG